jgi:hypothetical protein
MYGVFTKFISVIPSLGIQIISFYSICYNIHIYLPNIIRYFQLADAVDVKTTGRKGKYSNTMRRYHTYIVTKDSLHMNDIYIDIYNPIYEILHELHTR